MISTTTVCTSEKFRNAEQLWFWFIYSKSIQSSILHLHGTPTRRPCELLDVETLITKLYLCGRLTTAQLDIMKKYGDRRRAPNQYIWAENKDAALWNNAMSILNDAGRVHGWIE